MNMSYRLFTTLFFFLCFVLSPGLWAQIDKAKLTEDLRILSSDEYAGRATGENEKARAYLLTQLEGAAPAYNTLVDTFGFLDRLKNQHKGYNVVAAIQGKKFPDQYIVLSAHYDHLGIRKEQIYNGADDNASGTTALLSLYHHFKKNPPRHSIIFAFFDAEELGLKGADRFVEDPPVPREQLLLNINMDMVGRNNDNTINICGVYDFPQLARPLKKVIKKSDLIITQKHEGPDYKGSDNWTMSSDHGMFLARKIPYLYFGVEDHPGYHKPTDDFEFINLDFFHAVTNLVRITTERFDRKLKKKGRA